MADSFWNGGVSQYDVSGSYNTPGNWSAGVPTGTASFGQWTYTRYQVTSAADTTVGGWNFLASAQSFVLSPNTYDVTFTGAGIQTFVSTLPIISTHAALNFRNSSSAGFSSISGESDSEIAFYDTSNAGSGALVVGSFLDFFNSSNAGDVAPWA